MTVIAHITMEITPDQYDAVRTACGWLDRQPDGGIAHLSWWEGGTNHNVDAWESEAACAAFAESRLGPAMAAAGVDVEPKMTFHPAHEVYVPQATTITATTP